MVGQGRGAGDQQGKSMDRQQLCSFPATLRESSCKFHVETRVSPPMADIVAISCCGSALVVLHVKTPVLVVLILQ
jgi:hypothetical protein